MSYTEDHQDDLYSEFQITVDKGQAPLRVDKFLFNKLEKISRSRIQIAAKAGNIKINGNAVKSNYKVRPLDQIRVLYPKSVHEPDLSPEPIPLDIVYEDEDVLVLNKTPGLVVHPGVGNHSGTLINALLYHIEQLPVKDDETRPGLVHRLDKDTSGLMVVAKNELSMSHLARQFFERTVKRKYHSIVWGDFEEDQGTVQGNIGRDKRNSQNYTVYPRGEYGKTATTHYSVIERYGYISLVECKLETGRTHQIRVHMKYINHPVFNDERYGGNKIMKGATYSKYKQFVHNCFTVCPRQALHAKELGFIHPKTGEELFFESDLPQDMALVLEKWKRFTKDFFRKNK